MTKYIYQLMVPEGHVCRARHIRITAVASTWMGRVLSDGGRS